MKIYSSLVLLCFLVFSCKDEILPKPKSYLKLKYPIASYSKVQTSCPYTFEISNQSKLAVQNNCWVKIEYPKLKATVHITYREITGNLNEILLDVEKLTYDHTLKADEIPTAVIYENFDKEVYGKVNNVIGNVASNIQFSATDSTKHMLSGALYFYVKPNYDSILPAIKYIEKDMIHLIETLEWK